MGALALGMGLSGICMNVVRIILIYIGERRELDHFVSTMEFYFLNTIIQLIAATMYFVELKNRQAVHVNTQVRMNDKNKPKVSFFAQAKLIASDAKEVKWILMMLFQVYVVTFMVFPGVTNLAELTFLETKGVWF